MRRCGCFFFLFLIVLFGAGLVGWVWFTGQSATPEEARTEAVATPDPSVTPEAPPLEDKMESFATAITEGPARLVVTEDDLNAALAEQLLGQTGVVRARNVRVELEDGHAYVEGKLALEGLEMPIRADLKLDATPDGGVRVDLGAVDIGQFSRIPGLQKQVEDGLREQIGDGTMQFDEIKIDELTIEQDKLIVVGQKR